MPTSVDQAHAEYDKVVPMISHCIQDLEAELTQLYASQPQLDPIPPAIHVHADEIEAAKFFFKMVKDKQYVTLQAAIIKVWREWQTLQLEAESTGEDTPASSRKGTLNGEDQDVRRQLKQEKARHEELLEMQKKAIVTMATGGFGSEDDSAGYSYKIEMAKQYEDRVTSAKRWVIVANRKAPQMADAWAPFSEHLQACARKMAFLDHSPTSFQGEDLQRLRLRAKISLLERYRSGMSFCQMVWARMTASTPPSPLRELRSGKAQQTRQGE